MNSPLAKPARVLRNVGPLIATVTHARVRGVAEEPAPLELGDHRLNRRLSHAVVDAHRQVHEGLGGGSERDVVSPRYRKQFGERRMWRATTPTDQDPLGEIDRSAALRAAAST